MSEDKWETLHPPDCGHTDCQMVARCEWGGSWRGCVCSVDKYGILIHGSSSPDASSPRGRGKRSALSSERWVEKQETEDIFTSTFLSLEFHLPEGRELASFLTFIYQLIFPLVTGLNLTFLYIHDLLTMFTSSNGEHLINLFTCLLLFAPTLNSDLSEGRGCFNLVHPCTPSISNDVWQSRR